MVVWKVKNSPKYIVIDCSIESHEELHDTFNNDTVAEKFMKNGKDSDLVLYKRIDTDIHERYRIIEKKVQPYDPSDRYGNLES
jgi:hypothetical protein